MSEKIVQLNEEVIKGQIKELVRDSVEERLNGLLEAEAKELTNAAKYERTADRQGYRSGHYSRNLTTTSGDVTLNVPKLKGVPPPGKQRGGRMAEPAITGREVPLCVCRRYLPAPELGRRV